MEWLQILQLRRKNYYEHNTAIDSNHKTKPVKNQKFILNNYFQENLKAPTLTTTENTDENAAKAQSTFYLNADGDLNKDSFVVLGTSNGILDEIETPTKKIIDRARDTIRYIIILKIIAIFVCHCKITEILRNSQMNNI